MILPNYSKNVSRNYKDTNNNISTQHHKCLDAEALELGSLPFAGL